MEVAALAQNGATDYATTALASKATYTLTQGELRLWPSSGSVTVVIEETAPLCNVILTSSA